MLIEKKGIRNFVKVIIVVAIPVFISVVAFCGIGFYIQHSGKILPNISVAGVDVSWHTHGEAMGALDLLGYETRAENAMVTIEFPDGHELNITGADVKFKHKAHYAVSTALSSGRGHGFMMDVANFLGPTNTSGKNYEIDFELDKEFLRARVEVFTRNYNRLLEERTPVINDSQIIVVKGVGLVVSCAFDVFEMAFDGLFESLVTGQPVRMSYSLPESRVNTSELIEIWKAVHTHPVCASYDAQTKTVTEAVVGVNFDVEGAIELLGEAETGQEVLIEKLLTNPTVTQEYLEEVIFRDLIGQTVTHVAGTAYRLNNVELSSAAVDGYVVLPGKEFSFNRVVGRRTWERGYRPAPAFSGGQTVQAIGGGICQVSSSIYSAIMDTDILVTERFPHGRPVAYLPRGRDAAVSWGTLDFRFVNNTDYPIRIDADVNSRTLTVRVYGTMHEAE